MTIRLVSFRGMEVPLAEVSRLTGWTRQAIRRRLKAGLPLDKKMPGTRLIDLSGQRFGSLTAISRVNSGSKVTRWLVRCDCGNEKIVAAGKLRSGRRTSCEPCSRSKTVYGWKITHGHTRGPASSKEYTAWQSMNGRCYRKSNPSYANYGGIGVAVYGEWMTSFQSFYDHIGPAPSSDHSVDRIDPLRGYEPGNVRWATASVQANNRRNNVLITRRGETMTMAQWSRRMGDPRGCIVHKRINELGWTAEEALDTPYERGVHCKRRAV